MMECHLVEEATVNIRSLLYRAYITAWLIHGAQMLNTINENHNDKNLLNSYD